jgi:hypothetical protein
LVGRQLDVSWMLYLNLTNYVQSEHQYGVITVKVV